MSNFKNWNEYWDKKENVSTERGSFNVYSAGNSSQICIFCAHGAGHSGLSFSLLAKELSCDFMVIAPDLKCHGDTPGDESVDLSMDSLVLDFISIGTKLIPPDVRLILLGHSMGGAIATIASSSFNCFILMVLDTVEGNIMLQLPAMKNLLTRRPDKFSSVDEVITYIATSGEMQNLESAAVSSGGRFKLIDGYYTWKTDLLKCEKFWAGWFDGFANKFMHSKPYKVIFLPSIDRLDTPFNVGHMSGVFQVVIVPNTLHCVHEDDPVKVATEIRKIVKRLDKSTHWG